MKAQITEAIRLSGIPRTTFYRLLKNYPEFEKFALVSVIGNNLIKDEVIEALTKKQKEETK